MMNFTDLDRATDPSDTEVRRRPGGAAAQTVDSTNNTNANTNSTTVVGATDFDQNMRDYEYMATPLNPTKMERFRLENLILMFSIIIGIVFTIIALNTPVATYVDSEVLIEARVLHVHTCLYPSDGYTTLISGAKMECDDYPIYDLFCDGFRESTAGFIAAGVLTCVSGAVALVFAIFLTVGCALVCKHLAFAITILQLTCLFIATITSSTVLTNRRCTRTSLKSIGFKYGPAFPLVLTAFILQALAIIFYIVRRCVKPIRYYTDQRY